MTHLIQTSDTPLGGSDEISSRLDRRPAADEAYLRETLKRCSPSTFEAACHFRQTRRTVYLPPIVLGIIERFVERSHRNKLPEAADTLRLAEDLGIDSLTMMEIVLLTEDVLQISIENDELRHLRTVGDVKLFIACKVRSLPHQASVVPGA